MAIVLFVIAKIASKSQNKINNTKNSRVANILHRFGELLILLIGVMFIFNGGSALWPLIS